MRIVIFAGGAGLRLWPISRQNSPKQFEPIIGEQSTLQLAVDRVAPVYGFENIHVATNQKYLEIVQRQLPNLSRRNIITEPARRDLGPAVGLAMAHIAALNPDEPVAILWSDNYIENVPKFIELLDAAEALVRNSVADMLFIGETPRFPNENLGWIGIGKFSGQVGDLPYYAFRSLTYRPSREMCQQMFDEGTHVWNTGFFITTPAFIRDLYRKYSPAMWDQLVTIEESIGTGDYESTLTAVYPALAAISFDDAILTHLDHERALVLHSDMGWSDPGTLYALKETLNPDPSTNVTKGLVVDTASRDSLIYNYEAGKLLVAVGLDGMIVVNTDDAILVVHKDNIPLVKKVIKGLEDTALESFS